MPTPNRDNIRQWLNQSDVDFFTHFVKAWIPFNAWYRQAYDTLRTERDILDEVKTDGNRIRTRFMPKLEGADPDSEEIRNHIAALHRRLSADPLHDRNNNLVSFENVCTGRNPLTICTKTYRRWTYKVERRTGPKQVVSEVLNSSSTTVCTITQTGDWDIDALRTHSDFLSLGSTKQPVLLQCYQEAHPMKFESLVAPANAQPRDTIQMDTYNFVNDRAAIFAGLIEILYAMRNLLFHGELVPDPEANRTYEPAYHLLRHLTRCIT